MTQTSLTQEQQAKLAEAVEIAKLFEQKARVMSELASAIADKYCKRLYEAAIAAEQKLKN